MIFKDEHEREMDWFRTLNSFDFLPQVKIFPGRKGDYEPRSHVKQGNETDFLTAVEFSLEDPYGKAVALLDLKSKLVTVPYFLTNYY